MQLQKIIGLHNHVVEFQESQALLHTVLVALSRQHAVDGEMRSDISQQLNIIQLSQPVAVVDNQRLVIAEIDKPRHLLLEAVAVVLNILIRQHPAHIGTAGRVTYSTCAATHQADRTMTCPLHVRHYHQPQKMPHMQAVRRRVKAHVKGHLFIGKHAADLVLVGTLGYVAPFLQNIKNTGSHFALSLLS